MIKFKVWLITKGRNVVVINYFVSPNKIIHEYYKSFIKQRRKHKD